MPSAGVELATKPTTIGTALQPLNYTAAVMLAVKRSKSLRFSFKRENIIQLYPGYFPYTSTNFVDMF